MIIHSTTLDTEAKVIAQYGGTKWIQHSGYVLRGATSGVVSNSAVKTGGSDNMIIPYHNHTFTGTSKNYTSGNQSANHTHNFSPSGAMLSGFADKDTGAGGLSVFLASGSYTNPWQFGRSTQNNNTDHTHTTTIKPEGTIDYAGTNGNTTNANIPNYKSVYIWERVS